MPILQSPVKTAILKGTSEGGSIRQFFGENPKDYAPFGVAAHNGLDISTFKGDSILAVAPGRIFDTGSLEDSSHDAKTQYNGNVVWLLTDPCSDGKAYYCVYGHLDSISVKKGQIVRAGDEIGKEGNTGFVVSDTTKFWGNAPSNQGTHLHFGVYDMTEGDDGYKSWSSGGKFWHITNPANGYKGAVDPQPLLDEEIAMLTQKRNFLRSLLIKLGLIPVA